MRCRYQPPIPADQVKVSTEADYDGGGSSFLVRVISIFLQNLVF